MDIWTKVLANNRKSHIILPWDGAIPGEKRNPEYDKEHLKNRVKIHLFQALKDGLQPEELEETLEEVFVQYVMEQ